MLHQREGSHERGFSNLSGFHFPSAEQESKHFDMDYNPVSTTKWTDIPSVRTYDDFFEAHAGEFRKGR